MTDELPTREHREDVSLRTRAEDGGGSARFRVWWRDGGKDLVVGFVATFAAIGCLILGALVYGIQKEQGRNAKATAHAAKVSCQRALVLGPPLADYYASDPAFPRTVLREYRRTIPRACPK